MSEWVHNCCPLFNRLLTCTWCWWQCTWQKKPETPCRELYRCSPSRPAVAWRSHRSARSPHMPCTLLSYQGSLLPTGVLLGTLSEMQTLFCRVLHPGCKGFLRDCRTLNLSVSQKTTGSLFWEEEITRRKWMWPNYACHLCSFRLQKVFIL